MDTDGPDERMCLHLYGTLTGGLGILHAQEMAYLLTQPPPWLMMPTHTLQGEKGSAPLSAALHSERVMSISTTALDSGKTAGKWTPPRYMVMYDCTPLAGTAVLRAFGHAASCQASVFIAGLLLPNPASGSPAADMQDELDALVRTGKRAGLKVTAEIVMPPTMEAVADRADVENVTQVICMHPPHALHEVFTKRGILLTLRD